MAQGHHARVVRTRTEFGEDDLARFRQEELHSPDACTTKGLCHFVGHMLGLAKSAFADTIRLPTLSVVTAFLNVTNRRTEQRGTILLRDREQCELGVEIDELLDNHFLHITTAAIHGFLKSGFQLVAVMHITLTVSARRHQGLHHTREPNLAGCLAKLVKGLGIEIFCGPQTEFA